MQTSLTYLKYAIITTEHCLGLERKREHIIEDCGDILGNMGGSHWGVTGCHPEAGW